MSKIDIEKWIGKTAAHPDIRIPSEWLREIARTLNDQTSWDFYTEGHNHLHVKKYTNENEVEVLDFFYNPGD